MPPAKRTGITRPRLCVFSRRMFGAPPLVPAIPSISFQMELNL
jgi:hypothetical protein